MGAETSFDYYYGDESNQFSFYRIPRRLITGTLSNGCPRTQAAVRLSS